jgi:ABC-2 type transport system ATP-binding protein
MRLDLAAAILACPPVLFLDEPTTGLDPTARLELWQAVRDLAAATSVLLTTQYLEEADRLAGRVAVLAAGQVITEGTSEELKRRFGARRLEIMAARPARWPQPPRCWPDVTGVMQSWRIPAGD